MFWRFLTYPDVLLCDAELVEELLVVVTLTDVEEEDEGDGVGELPGVELEETTGHV